MRNEGIGRDNGAAAIAPDEPVVAGGRGAWKIVYTAGPAGMATGGSVRFEIPYGFSPPQLIYPADDGYVRAECSRDGVRLRVALEVPVALDPEPFYYVTRWGRHVFVQLVEGELRHGDTVTLSYGDTIHEPNGAVAQYFAGEAEFTVATDCDGTRSATFSGYTLIERQPTLEVGGGPIDSVEVYAPSVAVVGEPIRVRIVSRDEHGNTSGAELLPEATGLKLICPEERETDRQPKPSGPGLVGRVTPTLAGRHECGVLGPRLGMSARSNPIVCEAEPPEYRLFWGDLHVHTKLSDGLGTPESAYNYAILESGLDFAAVADHGQYMSDEDWETVKTAVRKYNIPGEFVSLLGYEFSHNQGPRSYGDKCLYYPGEDGPLLRATDIMRSEYIDPNELTEEWKAHGAMMIVHQHAGGIRRYYDPDVVRLAEIYSIWGGSEALDTKPLVHPAQRRDFSGETVQDALESGFVLGTMAASDCHAGQPGNASWLRLRQAYRGGLTGVWARELTREAIWEALWSRRCYGTTGARVIVRFSVDGQPMGTVMEAQSDPGEHEIHVEATAHQPIWLIEVLRGTEVIRRQASICEHEAFTFHDRPPAGAAPYYYVRVLLEGERAAWSSPVWVRHPGEARVDV